MSGNGGQSSWQRTAVWLVAVVVVVDVVAGVLPRVVVPLSVLAVVAVLVRLVFFFTRL